MPVNDIQAIYLEIVLPLPPDNRPCVVCGNLFKKGEEATQLTVPIIELGGDLEEERAPTSISMGAVRVYGPYFDVVVHRKCRKKLPAMFAGIYQQEYIRLNKKENPNEFIQ